MALLPVVVPVNDSVLVPDTVQRYQYKPPASHATDAAELTRESGFPGDTVAIATPADDIFKSVAVPAD